MIKVFITCVLKLSIIACAVDNLTNPIIKNSHKLQNRNTQHKLTSIATNSDNNTIEMDTFSEEPNNKHRRASIVLNPNDCAIEMDTFSEELNMKRQILTIQG